MEVGMKLRFSLSWLFVGMTIASLFLGYSQVRRQRILSRVEELRSDNLSLDAPAELIDCFWQRPPAHARGYFIDPNVEQALKALGVRDIQWHCVY
jgi:hypothetical protein